ncbi:tryptophan 7-halogenase [Streptomyces sp. NPDC048171]|uniref:tryptophan 7-halogenase n=1 Tax=unclassified Streptomyces TaxID=2593676 RepID=UPI001370F3BB|nr:tryptophan 7-halogenase [Streptomyces sp. SID5789]MZE73132.1 FAD-dependent oxidoreductase [Streptomyces sp. SID5789]MZE73572.1 FAD-dependent oxidoreductase [Streptomyces sp. SID5789]
MGQTRARTEEADVVVVGGGPAGSTAAALVALRGHRVVLLEKERFPRYQIGESLLPATVHGVCRLTGVADELAAAGFTRKRGGTFRWGARPDPWTFSFSVSPRMAGPSSFAYQVERSKFDHILLNHARNLGVDVREGSAVDRVLEDGERVSGVGYTDEAGERHEITSRYVIDASGNTSRLFTNVAGTRNYSEFFRSLALFGYFTGGKRLPEPNSGNILSAAFKSGWFWYIPLSPELTSVGAVVRRDMAQKVQGDPEAALRALIDECPLVKEYLADAERVRTGQYGRLRVRKDYSYQATSYWRPGMVLVGDAACFVDPVFSSGVHLATFSALLAARSINSVLAGTVGEQDAFREFEARYRREYSVFYEFLVSFYDMNVSEESYFWRAKKVTGSSAAEFESFIDLVGGVASGEAALTTDGRTTAAQLRSRSAEFSGAVDQVAADDGGTMVPLFRSEVVRNAMRQGGQVQSHALLGDDAEDETPLFPGGLVGSPDGLSWQIPKREETP